MLKVALVALPWSDPVRPSAPLAALSAHLKANCAELDVTCFYAYLEVAKRLGRVYEMISLQAYTLGETLYGPCLFPEKRASALRQCVTILQNLGLSQHTDADDQAGADKAAELIRDLDAHLDSVAERLAGHFDVIGLTTCYGQLFANLALCKKLKALAPDVITVLGGSTLSSTVGPSLIREFDFIDYIVQGEGERPFLHLTRTLAADRGADPLTTAQGGLLHKTNAAENPKGVPFWEIDNIDELPLPDFDQYAKERGDDFWMMPLEGSRGCWWDRKTQTKNPKKACYFCNLNVQWKGYKEKSIDRLVGELETLSDRYENNVVFFLDNIIRLRGNDELAGKLQERGRDFAFFYEMRANITPYEFLSLWRAGLNGVQFGVEGLSTSYLRRIGKGTTTIQNLQAMKTAHELNVFCKSNLLMDFPGSTPEEVRETCEVIRRFAFPFQPLNKASFWLGIDSTVMEIEKEFPVTNIRNADFYRAIVPEQILARISLFDKSFDNTEIPTDWEPVVQFVEWWEGLHRHDSAFTKTLMSYMDGGSYLTITYRFYGQLRRTIVRNLEREIYLFCMQIRTTLEILEEFSGRIDSRGLDELLQRWSDENLLYREGGRALALAPATRPDLAAKRIEAAHARDQRKRQERRPAQPAASCEEAHGRKAAQA